MTPEDDLGFEIRPLSAVVGAEILGIDLRSELSGNVGAGLRWLAAVHGVLVVRSQHLDHESHLRFARALGPLHVHPTAVPVNGHPELLAIETAPSTPSAARAGTTWHADVTCEVSPPAGAVLRMDVVPEIGGDTVFASSTAAFEGLSTSYQRLLLGLHAHHSLGHSYRNRIDRSRPSPDVEAVHPVICRHPITDRPVLFVNEAFTTRVLELSPLESDGVLRTLTEHVKDPALAVRVRWGPGDVVIWDNLAVLHKAVGDNGPHHRLGYRATLAGAARPVAFAVDGA